MHILGAEPTVQYEHTRNEGFYLLSCRSIVETIEGHRTADLEYFQRDLSAFATKFERTVPDLHWFYRILTTVNVIKAPHHIGLVKRLGMKAI